MTHHFADRLCAAIDRRRTVAVVGIDPTLEKLPAALKHGSARPKLSEAVAALEEFSRTVIDCVAPLVPAVKINSGFFEALYAEGLAAYYRLVAHAHRAGLLVIGDIKRGDIGSTAQLYARGHIATPSVADVDEAGIPDAVTLAGYLGENAVRPFIEEARKSGRGVYVLVRPSDPGADEVHEFRGSTNASTANVARDGAPFYMHMAGLVRRWGEGAGLVGECGLSCVGAVVAPKDAVTTIAIRSAMPLTPFLVPGYGAQGGTADACKACFLQSGRGAVVNASRSVIFAYENKTYQSLYGGNWEGCVKAACKDFVADINSITIPAVK